MKWLKLDCDFRNDPKILALSQQFGGKEACAFWVLLLTYVGANGMPQCEISLSTNGVHSPILLASFLHTKPKVALSMLSACAHLGLITRERWENDMTIAIPNMLKRIDDYTRKVRTKSGLAPDKLSPILEEEEEVEREVEKKPPNPLPGAFVSRWDRYPNRVGRKAAERHFLASVKTEANLRDFDQALANYLKCLEQHPDRPMQNGSTWFNNWSDWVNWKEPERSRNGNSNGKSKEHYQDRIVRENKETAERLHRLFGDTTGDGPGSQDPSGTDVTVRGGPK